MIAKEAEKLICLLYLISFSGTYFSLDLCYQCFLNIWWDQILPKNVCSPQKKCFKNKFITCRSCAFFPLLTEINNCSRSISSLETKVCMGQVQSVGQLTCCWLTLLFLFMSANTAQILWYFFFWNHVTHFFTNYYYSETLQMISKDYSTDFFNVILICWCGKSSKFWVIFGGYSWFEMLVPLMTLYTP